MVFVWLGSVVFNIPRFLEHRIIRFDDFNYVDAPLLENDTYHIVYGIVLWNAVMVLLPFAFMIGFCHLLKKWLRLNGGSTEVLNTFRG